MPFIMVSTGRSCTILHTGAMGEGRSDCRAYVYEYLCVYLCMCMRRSCAHLSVCMCKDVCMFVCKVFIPNSTFGDVCGHGSCSSVELRSILLAAETAAKPH